MKIIADKEVAWTRVYCCKYIMHQFCTYPVWADLITIHKTEITCSVLGPKFNNIQNQILEFAMALFEGVLSISRVLRC